MLSTSWEHLPARLQVQYGERPAFRVGEAAQSRPVDQRRERARPLEAFRDPPPACFARWGARALVFRAGPDDGIEAIASRPRRAISSGLRSSLWVASDQTWPNGSRSWP